MLLTPSRYIAKKVHTFATAGNQTFGQRFQVNRHLQLHHDGFCDLVNVSLFFTHITEYCNEYLRLNNFKCKSFELKSFISRSVLQLLIRLYLNPRSLENLKKMNFCFS